MNGVDWLARFVDDLAAREWDNPEGALQPVAIGRRQRANQAVRAGRGRSRLRHRVPFASWVGLARLLAVCVPRTDSAVQSAVRLLRLVTAA